MNEQLIKIMNKAGNAQGLFWAFLKQFEHDFFIAPTIKDENTIAYLKDDKEFAIFKIGDNSFTLSIYKAKDLRDIFDTLTPNGKEMVNNSKGKYYIDCFVNDENNYGDAKTILHYLIG